MSTPEMSNGELPMTIGVFGGSFSPIHLGHALLAITTQQTKPVDQVVLVPVYKHAVKTDLLPFEDRVEMCKLAVAPFSGGDAGKVVVSTIEQQVGESNGPMLRALKKQYPPGSKLLWICGDDFFNWMERPKGVETLKEVSGLIVQRRLHKANTGDRFFKEPIDEGRIRSFAAKLNLEIDFIYGELPHFSSSLVRRAPGHWRSFLPQSVSEYLDARPHLLAMLHDSLEAEAMKEEQAEAEASDRTGSMVRRVSSLSKMADSSNTAAGLVMQGLEVVHALQLERGYTGLKLSMGTHDTDLHNSRANTDAILSAVLSNEEDEQLLAGYDEVHSLAEALRHASTWLAQDRLIVDKKWQSLVKAGGVEGWTSRLDLVQKFNPRIDVFMLATIRALKEILIMAEERADSEDTHEGLSPRELSDLLLKWSEGKEALGRLRAFVMAGGPSVPTIVRGSLEMRERLNQTITNKEQSIGRVLSQEKDSPSRAAAPDALFRMLEKVSLWEWSIMGGCFASSTPLPLVHKLLAQQDLDLTASTFDVELFFESATSAIDLMLTVTKALAASGCARA